MSRRQIVEVDFSDIKGQEHCKRGLEVAAAGNHGVLLIGPPESGKTMLVDAFRTICDRQIQVIDNVIGGTPWVLRPQTILVATAWPCKCGHFTDPHKECLCTPKDIQDHLSGISSELLENIDIHIEVPRIKYETISRRSETSEDIRKRVELARQSNDAFFWELDKEANELMKLAILELGMSSMACDKIGRVAGTIATLDNPTTKMIQAYHISEAISYRSLDRNLWG